MLNPEFNIAGFFLKTLHNTNLPEICYNGKLNEVQGRLAKHLITQSYAIIKHLTSRSGAGIFLNLFNCIYWIYFLEAMTTEQSVGT